MRLHSLDIHGFKSFADKTTLEFHEGVTGIVGPNGCGKSNVVDAIRWVLGETSAKALRGGEMADVIFNGTDARRASGMAAVTLNMTDCEEALGTDFNEVAITRRVFRDGKSEYRINDTLCRLRDIHDLFLDTGIGRSAYSVMEQGKIDQLLSSKPEDRRAVFEEAAGISKFKKEKREALRKLELTSGNLLRVSDVMEEQERRIGALKRQVSKARRYQALAVDVKVLETHLAHQEYRELLAGRNFLKSSIDEIDLALKKQEETIPELEGSIATLRESLARSEREAAETTQHLNEAHNSIQTSRGQIKLNAERRDDYTARIKRYEEEIAENKTRLSQQEVDLQDTLKQVAQIQERIGNQQSTLAAHKAKVEEVRQQRQSVEAEQKAAERDQLATERQLASINAKLESYRSSTSNTRERADALQSDHLALEKAEAKTQSDLSALTQKISHHQAQKPSLLEARDKAEDKVKTLRAAVETAHQSLREEQKTLSTRTSRLEVLQNLLSSGEGLGSGSQSVLSGLDDPALYKPLLGGTLAQAIRTDERFITAIEAALGSRLSSIIIKDADAAKSIIDTLTAKSLGNAELLVPSLSSSLQSKNRPAAPAGSVGWAAEMVTTTAALTPTVEALLGGTLIVEDLATAITLRATHPSYRFVSLTGELVSPEGFLQGGKSKEGNTSTLRLQNEVEELQHEIKTLEKELTKTEGKITTTTSDRDQATQELDHAKTAIQQFELTTNALKSDENALQREVTNFHNKIDSLQRERASLQQREKEVSDNLTKLEEDLKTTSTKRAEIEQTLQTITGKIRTIREDEVSSFDTLSEMQTAVAVERRSYDALQRQREPLQARIQELMQSTGSRQAEIQTLQERITSSHTTDKDLADKIGNSEAGIKQFSEKLEALKAQATEVREKLQRDETALSEARRNLLSLTEKRGKEDVSYTKIDLKIENITVSQREKHQVEISDFRPDLLTLAETTTRRAKGEPETKPETDSATDDRKPQAPSQIDWATVEELAREVRQKIDSMGAVNVDAIAEFDELEERHTFVLKQFDDLTNAKNELTGIIDRINTETTKMFSETFHQVCENFRQMFQALFGEKGKADLILTDDEDPLESGIEIIAKPPGKKLQSITLLSGGERSMTAVALLFSIYMVKPSPFCVLDELDAPLDESNISRFLNMLEEFISQSQFIIVTHNKRTMARCDVLYGVTMPELGVSRPVSMRLSQAQDIIDQDQKNKKSADSKTDKGQSPAANAAAQISS